jgi:hypothetical protein
MVLNPIQAVMETVATSLTAAGKNFSSFPPATISTGHAAIGIVALT